MILAPFLGISYNLLMGRMSIYKQTAAKQPQLHQKWRTPSDLFRMLHQFWKFQVDAFASKDDALLPRYWTEKDDGFSQDWTGARVFANPPFRRTRQQDTALVQNATVAAAAVLVLPVPASSSQYISRNPPRYFVPLVSHQLLPHPELPLTKKGTQRKPAFDTALYIYGAATSEQVAALATLGAVYELNHQWESTFRDELMKLPPRER